ncbi:MAG: biopolymer transporter ExbD [Gallionella sp.]|nr:biopolymer transporter ExbD [Gallionella sp.]MDH4286662.1 biopolymer transporter ExbD [Gallionella sp.]
MNFQRGRSREEPEINLIALIDVLLVILIFLMVTTSYAKFAELQINLPQAGGEASAEKTKPINVTVDASEHYGINNQGVHYTNIENLAAALKNAAAEQTDPVIVINADAKASHQSVINVMEAARQAGYGRITFTTQSQPK